MVRLAGKVALITGAASGIGRAVTHLFLQEGASVIAADLDQAGAAAALGSGSGRAIRLDVAAEADWDSVFRTIDQLDIVVASAGISAAQPIVETSLAEWRRIMAVNLDGAFLGLRYAISAMRKYSRGSIVLVASASGIRAAAGAAAYSASKAAVRMLAKTAALECKSQGIRVNTVSPAGVVTPIWKTMPFWKGLVEEKGSEAAAWDALGGADPSLPAIQRMAFPEEIASAILFLASEESAHMTGADLVIDGGYTA